LLEDRTAVSSSNHVVEFSQVSKRYGDVSALADVSFTIDQGEFVFLSGASGAGKSTLLRLIFAGELATSGQLLVFGRNLARMRSSQIPYLRRSLGIVFQDFKLLPDRTVGENVGFPLEVRGVRAEEVRHRATAILASVGLEDKVDKFPLTLSGGEQQRIAVARAMVVEPALLLADEPTGNLDPERTEEVMDLLQAGNMRGTTVVVATHDRALIARHQRRVIMLEHGRLVGGPPAAGKAVAG
jgi:cell division transport system ATP-binding protein